MGSLYSEHQSWLHGVPAAVKLLLFALLGTALYALNQPAPLAWSAAACGLLFISLGQAIRPTHKLLASLVLASLLILAFHIWMQQAVVGWVSVLRLISASLLGVALTLTTRSSDLLEVMERMLTPLQRLGIRTERLALLLAMMLRFTEHFFVVWKQLDDAHRIRTGRSGGLRLLAPLTIHMLVSARRVADTLEMRMGG